MSSSLGGEERPIRAQIRYAKCETEESLDEQ